MNIANMKIGTRLGAGFGTGADVDDVLIGVALVQLVQRRSS